MADSSYQPDTIKSSPRTVDNIVSKILNPSLTAYYECHFYLNEKVKEFINTRAESGIGKQFDSEFQDLLTLSCSEASLPGSSLNTVELNNDYTGVTQRHAYRRVYDDRIDLTFYVDNRHSIIYFFENWISYIVNENNIDGMKGPAYFYRVNYPSNYKSDFYITKFEKDYSDTALTYQFFEAFPISITSMPVSYDSSSLLKCTVSFTYTRYILGYKEVTKPVIPDPKQQSQQNGSQFDPNLDLGIDYGGYTTPGGVPFPPANASGNTLSAF